jgi:hypothetical protein
MNSRRRLFPALVVAAALLLSSLACISSSAVTPAAVATAPAPTALATAAAPAAPAAKCIIPDLAGMDQQSAMKNLAGLGLTPVKTLDYSDTIPAEAVITTDPAPGTALDNCQTDITVVISMGSRKAGAVTPAAQVDTPAAPPLIPTPDMSSSLDKPMYNILYQENFDTLKDGMNPAWRTKINPGSSLSTKDGTLVVTGTILAQVGDTSWQDYRITFSSITGSGYAFVAFFRTQSDTTNSMAMSCQDRPAAAGSGNALHCELFRIVNNVQTRIDAAYPADVCPSICDIMIEAAGNAYRFVFNGVEQFKITDNTFKTGGVGFYVKSATQPWTLSSFDVSTPPHPASPGDILFRDDFKTSAWDTGSYDGDYASYDQSMLNGKYQWHIKAKKGVAQKVCMKAVTLPGVFTFSVNVKVISGPKDIAYGLVFRCQDNSNLYYYNVSENGPWGFFKLINLQWTKVVGEDTSPVLPGDTNQLQVIGDGTNYAFTLNGHLIQQVTESQFKMGGIGLGVELANPGDEATVEFDNLSITYP